MKRMYNPKKRTPTQREYETLIFLKKNGKTTPSTISKKIKKFHFSSACIVLNSLIFRGLVLKHEKDRKNMRNTHYSITALGVECLENFKTGYDLFNYKF